MRLIVVFVAAVCSMSAPSSTQVGGAQPYASSPPETASPQASTEETTSVSEVRPLPLFVKTVLGLVILMGLVWAGAHPAVRRFEETLGIRQAITAGFAFVGLGIVARQPAVGILTDDVLYELTPMVHFALGWLGLIIGFQFDVRALDDMPRGTAAQVAVRTLTPFVLVGVIGSALMLSFGRPWSDATFLRDAIVLATAGSIFATGRQVRPLPRDSGPVDLAKQGRLDSLDEIAAVIGLAVLGAFFRPQWVGFEWNMPGTVWLLLTMGVGVSVGLLTYAIVAGRQQGPDFLALCLGSVAMASGVAGYLMLSPLVVCFIAGAILVNLPGDHRLPFWSILTRFERPLYYLFLTLAGALWDVTDWRGWALVPAFLLCRVGGHLIADRLAPELSHEATDLRPVGLVPPVSMVSIAIVMSAQAIYRGPAIPWIVTAVLGGALISELLARRDQAV